MELYKLTGHELLEKIENKEITSEQIFLDLDERIKEVDAKVKAYVRIDRTKDFANPRTREPPNPRTISNAFLYPSRTTSVPTVTIPNAVQKSSRVLSRPITRQ